MLSIPVVDNPKDPSPVRSAKAREPLRPYCNIVVDDGYPAAFKSIQATEASQGVVALVRPRTFTLAEIMNVPKPRIVVLARLQDPGNVGTIVRLAAAFDAAGVILLPGCADAYGPKAMRASVGAILNVPVVEMTIDELLARERPIFAADAQGSSELPSGILVFGSEGQGVSDSIRKVAKLVRIEMSGRVESLNVAAAAAILLWRTFNERQAAHRRDSDR